MVRRKIQPDADRRAKRADGFKLERTDFDRKDVEVSSSSATSQRGLPMLPQAIVLCPHPFSISAINSVVVVFPFVPVMAMTGAPRAPAEFQFPYRFDFARRKICRQRQTRGRFPGSDDQVAGSLSFSAAGPERTVTPRARKSSRVDFRSFFSGGAVEHRNLCALAAEERAAAVPLRPAPRTAIFFPEYFTLSQFQGGQSEQREDGRQNPEPNDDGILLPPA